MGPNIEEGARQRQGTLMRNHCLVSHRYDVEKFTVPGSSNFCGKFCVEEMKEKSVAFCFLKLKAKKKANFFKIIGENMTFMWRI